jgi:hypothetical protein
VVVLRRYRTVGNGLCVAGCESVGEIMPSGREGSVEVEVIDTYNVRRHVNIPLQVKELTGFEFIL